METANDPFLLFEQNVELDLHSIFKQEAYALLVEAEQEWTDADELFARVDNLLNVASEMLEYSAYLNIVSEMLQCGGHNHMLEDRLRESSHAERAEHAHGDDKKSDNKKDGKRPYMFGGGLFFKVIQPQPQKKSLYDILLGVK